jgi:hypothetical protein
MVTSSFSQPMILVCCSELFDVCELSPIIQPNTKRSGTLAWVTSVRSLAYDTASRELSRLYCARVDNDATTPMYTLNIISVKGRKCKEYVL